MPVRGKNPFILSFGRRPLEYISRPAQTQEIIDMFTLDPITDQSYILLGVRGSGKTVMMSSIANELEQLDDWIVLRISPEEDIVESIYAGLYRHDKVHKILLNMNINISAFGSGITINDSSPKISPVSGMDDLLKYVQEHKKKVLITIDEISNTDKIRAFASAFQLWISKGRPVFFLGTSLYENIMELQNVRNMTFLYRAPKIYLAPLDISLMAASYADVFGISYEQAMEMAAQTKGYSFAFQALGYSYWEKQSLEKAIPQYDMLLREFSYEKLWSELSQQDKQVSLTTARHNGGKVKELREELGMSPSLFNVYRERLKNKGILDTRQYGTVSFALPRFAQFVLTKALFQESDI